MNMKVLTVIGTRPEAIKMAPLIKSLKKDSFFESYVCSTGQHKEMLHKILNFFDIEPEFNLNCMKPNQTLNYIISSVVDELDKVLAELKPDWILVQGDTTSCMAAALCAFNNKIKVGHVEAGLRTYNRSNPFPEEINRRIVSSIADLHFAPTELARDNLIQERVDAKTVFVTGNTVVDALLEAVNIVDQKIPLVMQLVEKKIKNRRMILVTGHRRESFGDGFEQICAGIKQLAEDYPDVVFVYPVHLNPNVQAVVHEKLSGMENILLIPPQDYPDFVWLMKHAYIILTDSGGVQEEAPSLNKPIVVFRETTERMEGVLAKTAYLAGVSQAGIYNAVARLLTDVKEYSAMASAQNPFGDGLSVARIHSILKNGVAE